MTVDWTISVWQLFSTLTAGVIAALGLWLAVLKVWHLLDKRMDRFEATLLLHASGLIDAGKRLDQHEDRMFQIVSDLQRVIGHLEVMPKRGDGEERRKAL